MIYFLFDLKPSLSISFLMALLISKKIKIKSKIKRIMFKTNKNWRFFSESSMKLLSINVKNVKKPIDNVIKNNKIRYMFFLIKSDILNK